MDSSFRSTQLINLLDLKNRLCSGERAALSKAITLVESRRADHQKLARELIEMVLPATGHSFRLGITGVPGVGKSTFIDAFGSLLTEKKKKVAVLSIDPTSEKTKGSILGDKTRMEQLAKDPKAFIRPSASRLHLGGVGSHTREAILLCEAAGYEVIIIETVGVGQSEVLVKSMVDYFLLLMLPGAGDALQGIKRGIMEVADHILINKADGNEKAAALAKNQLEEALHLFPKNHTDWDVPVALCSALNKTGLKEAWDAMCHFTTNAKTSGWLAQNRSAQNLKWYYDRVKQQLERSFFDHPSVQSTLSKQAAQIANQDLSVNKAVTALFDSYSFTEK